MLHAVLITFGNIAEKLTFNYLFRVRRTHENMHYKSEKEFNLNNEVIFSVRTPCSLYFILKMNEIKPV